MPAPERGQQRAAAGKVAVGKGRAVQHCCQGHLDTDEKVLQTLGDVFLRVLWRAIGTCTCRYT